MFLTKPENATLFSIFIVAVISAMNNIGGNGIETNSHNECGFSNPKFQNKIKEKIKNIL